MKKLLEMASQGDERALKDLDLDKPVNVKLDPPFKGMGIMRLTGECCQDHDSCRRPS